MRKLAAVLFILFLLVVAYWADSGTMPGIFKLVYAFPGGDKLGHLVLYGILALLLNAALPTRRIPIGRSSLRLGTFVAALFAMFEELTQFWFPSRTADLADLACGWLGVFTADWIAPRSRAVAKRDRDQPYS